jgi:uncharacterized protein with PQ loop repeat
MIEALGLIGSVLFALCALPQTVQCVRQGHSKGLSGLFLGAWGLGCVCMLAYSLERFELPLIINYAGSFLAVATMGFYKLFPRG